ncbi:hypothetical protein KL921_002802 [Ogataea angusta]|uniref:Brl1/Brr6 domain-containing protein n=1 Tax=Pichia angusta TaxID=870730 RepID=A0AAN6DF01_PICAN|nr:uncharacterized protein KL928_003038 [Ogataea angusta]KAG7810307.1 hypothetical protein KL921_002802 [Ogataea angusta]KAG7818037.1 hypothetical protein KL928_003038 [Ogataea angusta]KAG7828945.1 hypothetical protein KL920_002738 [Ogataea angusta]KAG7834255.1 hypothetical protein KL943_003551 [Ogataea angusta]KAG7839858.1 hypothetical protein KL942_002657 [Ogataea angusta]
MDHFSFLNLNDELEVEGDLLNLSLANTTDNVAPENNSDEDVSMHDVSFSQNHEETDDTDGQSPSTIDDLEEQLHQSSGIIDILHPTESGARLAQSGRRIHRIKDNVEIEIGVDTDLQNAEESALRYDGAGSKAKHQNAIKNENEDLSSESKTEGPKPNKFQIHNHYYISFNSPREDSELLPQPWTQESKPCFRIPYLLLTYLQIVLNTLTACYCLKLGYDGVQGIKVDIERAVKRKIHASYFEIEACRRKYAENHCDPYSRLPALQDICLQWEACMNKNPFLSVSYSTLLAEILGTILSSFAEPLNVKGFSLLLMILSFCYLSNFGWGFLRSGTYYGWNDEDSNSDVKTVKTSMTRESSCQRTFNQVTYPECSDDSQPH